MSRSNHYRICDECSSETPCFRHSREYWDIRYGKYQLTALTWDDDRDPKVSRWIDGRRPWRRKCRWPKYSRGSWSNPPPRWWWQEAHSRARAIYRQMMREEDPALPRERDLIDLWGWY